MHWNLREQESSSFMARNLIAKFNENKQKSEPLLRALASTTKGTFFLALSFYTISGLLQYSGPLLIQYIIAYITDKERDIQKGIILVLCVIFSRLLIAIFSSRAEVLLTQLGIRTSNAVNGLVYEKSLKFSLMRSAEHSQGSLVNHIQVDSDKLYNLGIAMGGVVILPLLIGVGIYFMYAAVGISFLAGIGVLIIMGAVNFCVGKSYFAAQTKVMEKKDERMKVSTEILNGIKYIKMSGWEEAFLKKVLGTREQELKWLKKDFVVTSISVFLLWLTPMMITTSIFGAYVFTGHDMNAKTAFTLISTVMILQQPLRTLPYVLTLMIESKISLSRVTKYLLAEEVQRDFITQSSSLDSDTAIKVQNGNFYWLSEEDKKKKKEKEEEDKKTEAEKKKKKKKTNDSKKSSTVTESIVVTSHNPPAIAQKESIATESVLSPSDLPYKLILKDINLEIKKGSFVAILGDVGSGKSSFLYSLIGEMKYDNQNPPAVELNGDVSYVTQQSWILNATVKDNIIFGNEFNPKKYEDTIKYSCLQSDFDILVNKDETEIGEKGVNLSGGQKARVSLARALYRNSDIYLLDDPLSAVDAHVGNFILKECFMNYLKDKTRVLVTHKFESLKYVDYIYIFSKGKIIEQGTAESLQDSEIFQEISKKCQMLTKEEEEQSAIDEIPPVIQEDPELTKATSEGSSSLILDEKVIKAVKEVQQEQIIKDITQEDDKMLQGKLMLDEDRETGEVGWNVWKAYFDYYGGYCYFVIVFLVMFIWICIQTGSNFWLSYWSDTMDHPKYSQAVFFEVYGILGLSYAFFCLIRIGMLFAQSLRCSRLLHKDMFSRIIRAPLNLFFDRVPTGRLLNRLSKDLSTLDSQIAVTFGSALVCGYLVLADVTVCLIVGTFWVFPLAIIFLICSYVVQRRYMKVNREAVRLESISKSPIVSYFSESLNGLTSVRAYNEEQRFAQKFHDLQDANIKNLILKTGLVNWFNLRVTFCTIFLIAPAVAIPLLVLSHETLASGMIGLLITYVIQINDDIMWTLWSVADFESKLISLERCRAFTLIEGEAQAKTQTPAAIANFSENWPTKGEIEYKDFYLKYRAALPHVLKGLNFTINRAEKVGVVGRTGSGKSTLFLSLLRIIEPSQGAIFIDGVDISQLGLDDLRRAITIIPQDPMLYKGTLRENLDLLKQYTDEELWLSLERVCMKEKFEQESGLDTEIKEGGENLSAGEKQLLCISRAILAKAKIILIDEATSNIDPKTEQTILDTIRNSFEDCTVITVAHRLKTIINSDRILMMGDGKVLEFDNPQTLIDDEKSHFHKLWMEHEHGSKGNF